MKKILILCAFLLAFCGFNSAEAVEQTTGVTFIYINGSNNLA